MGNVWQCENCGAMTVTPRRRTYGRHVWVMCPPCHKVTARKTAPDDVFGKTLRDLPEPMAGKAGWMAYRMAAQECQTTLWFARDRPARDRLHTRWNQWLGAIAALQQHVGTLLYRNTHDATGFLEEWMTRYGGPAVSVETARWLLPHVVSDTKQHLLTATPPRAILEQRASIPKPGTFTR